MSATEEALAALLDIGIGAARSSMPRTIDLGNGLSIPSAVVMDVLSLGLRAGIAAIVEAIEERRVDLVSRPDSPAPTLTISRD